MHHMANGVREFKTLADGQVSCDLSCLANVGSLRHKVTVDGRENVCMAMGSPLLDGGVMRPDTLVEKGRKCILVETPQPMGK